VTQMTPESYQQKAGRTECDQDKARQRLADDVRLVRILHAVTGLAGEVGELSSAVEKAVWYGQPLDEANLAEESGDCLWYIVELLNALGLRMGDVMAANIRKLAARYPEKYTDDRAAVRDVAAETEALLADHQASKQFSKSVTTYTSPQKKPPGAERPGTFVCRTCGRYNEYDMESCDSCGAKPTPDHTTSEKEPPGAEIRRTRGQVLAARATVVGCCSRHADNQACDCLERSLPNPVIAPPVQRYVQDGHGFGHRVVGDEDVQEGEY
jgi:NTP pyrophosphatase (non-canonical NTP hydrolase)